MKRQSKWWELWECASMYSAIAECDTDRERWNKTAQWIKRRRLNK